MPYLAPETAAEALAFLHEARPKVIAGCTDYFPSQKQGEVPENILDITRISGLRGVTKMSEGWRIGAATTWTDIVRADVPPAFDALKLAAKEVGSVQIQNRGTVAGNLCNASPAADGVPPLLTLDAQVEVSSHTATRTLPLADFLQGVRQIDLAQDEMVTAVLIPAIPDTATSTFLKLGSRTHLVISIAMIAVVLDVQNGQITDLRIAVGSCAPTAQRLPALEAAWQGQSVKAITTAPIDADALAPLSPITDVRGSADYRLDVVAEMCRRAILDAAAQGAT